MPQVNENKISTKNAFELPLIEHMDDIVDSFMGGKKAVALVRAQRGETNKQESPKSRIKQEKKMMSAFVLDWLLVYCT